MALQRVLHLSNEVVRGDAPGYNDGLEKLKLAGLLEHHETIALPELERRLGASRAHSIVRGTVQAMEPTAILIRSPHEGQFTPERIDWLRSRTVNLLYWEGDAWGGKKIPPPSTRVVAKSADHVFSVSLGEQLDNLFDSSHSGRVWYVPSCYCQVTFAERTVFVEDEQLESVSGICHIGNHVARAFILPGMPGARDRMRLARKLGRSGVRFDLFGAGWRGAAARGPIAFTDQLAILRHYAVNVNWDHFPDYPGFFSNRLPIALLAGRHHVTTKHPAMDWLPGGDHGLWLADSVEEVAEIALSLQSQQPSMHAPSRGRSWAFERLSQANLVRYMLSKIDDRIDPPRGVPWSLSLSA